MQEAVVPINGVPTHIMTWGAWIEEDISKFSEIVLCIPGNPGLPGFYTTFLSEIQKQIGEDTPVWILGHAGHDELSPNSMRKIPSLVGNHDLYNLKGQIEHKKQFILQYIPQTTKIHFIGHSIGAYMILNLLDDPAIKERAKYNYMLFPTIEKMAETKNGKNFTNILTPLIKLVELILILFNLLPKKLKYLFIYLYFLIFNIPEYFIGTVIKYLTCNVMEKVLFLAADEMKHVKELNVGQVESNIAITKFYYGPNDKWAPKEYFLGLKEKFPNSNAELCSRNMSHAFVLWSSKEMAVIVASWILDRQM